MSNSESSALVVGDEERRARLAVAILFLANGLTFASVVPWFPAIKFDLSLSNVALGVAIAAGPLGGLGFGLSSGALAARFGSGRTATATAVVGATALLLVGFAPEWIFFALAMLLLGSADAVTDSAMNAHGLRVQRRYQRSIINSFHALWSVGAVVGGLLAAAAAGLGVNRTTHLLAMAAVVSAIVLGSSRWLLSGHEESERSEQGASMAAQPKLVQAVRLAPMLLLGFGAIAALGGVVEEATASWSAVHLRETLGASPFVAGLGFVAAQAAMVVGRLSGDRLVDRFSARSVIRSGSLVALAGMLGVILGPHPAVVICGFGLAGFGVAAHFPLGMAAAGDINGVRVADGVAVASWLTRIGFFVMPPIVGLIADAASLRTALGLTAACAAAAYFVGAMLPNRDDGRELSSSG